MEKNNNDEDFASLLNESSAGHQSLEIGDMVKAQVIAIDEESVFLDLGTRENGMIGKSEFLISGKLTIKTGDTVEVYITQKKGGAYYCSRGVGSDQDQDQKTHSAVIPAVIKDAFHMGLAVKGKVSKVLKGGLEVMVMGHRAFCPISQVDLQYCDHLESFLDKTYDFKMIEFSEEDKNIVLSRKKLLLEKNEELAQKRWQEITEGGIYRGNITAIKNYGVFVDIGGVEGLLHVSEMSYEKDFDLANQFQVGDCIDVQIIHLDKEEQKISLSLKSALDDPWDTQADKLTPGSELQGKVVKLKPYGAFVQLFPGIEGLVHISKLGTKKRIEHPKQVLKPGQEVNIRILSIDRQEKRIALTMEEVDIDYSKDLKKLKKDQEKQFKQKTTMAALFDNLDKK